VLHTVGSASAGSEFERHDLTMVVDMSGIFHWDSTSHGATDVNRRIRSATNMTLCLRLSRFVHSCAELD